MPRGVVDQAQARVVLGKALGGADGGEASLVVVFSREEAKRRK